MTATQTVAIEITAAALKVGDRFDTRCGVADLAYSVITGVRFFRAYGAERVEISYGRPAQPGFPETRRSRVMLPSSPVTILVDVPAPAGDLGGALAAAQPETPITALAAEDFAPGYRYWSVRPGYESNWTVASVEIHTAEYEVDRGDGWFSPELVTITRRDGVVRILEKGEQVAIQGPWKTA